jgi:hypothetical protein
MLDMIESWTNGMWLGDGCDDLHYLMETNDDDRMNKHTLAIKWAEGCHRLAEHLYYSHRNSLHCFLPGQVLKRIQQILVVTRHFCSKRSDIFLYINVTYYSPSTAEAWHPAHPRTRNVPWEYCIITY